MHMIRANIVIPLTSAIIFIFGCTGASYAAQSNNKLWLSDMDLSKMSVGWGKAIVDKSIEQKTLTIDSKTYAKGVGSHAPSVMHIKLDGQTQRFSATVGVDDETAGLGSVVFKIYGDSKKIFDSGVINGPDPAQKINVDLSGITHLVLIAKSANDGVDYDHADWADAYFEYKGVAPVAVDRPVGEKNILTPKPGPEPKINGPRVFGTRPGNPFIYRIPATGTRPMEFTAENLPESMDLDTDTGIIKGFSPDKRGDYNITFKATNPSGSDQRSFKLTVGDTLALTPPMGWNSWYIHYSRVTDVDMRAAADIMIDSGMADFGYMYVNIDDCWSKRKNDKPYRSELGTILPNEKFPDMPALTEYIHSKGLRAGIYTSPGPWNCAGYTGSYQHEQADAQTFAKWGFDFLKHDWCSYGNYVIDNTHYEFVKPYALMGEILKNVDRDIVYNLCQYGIGQVWTWGTQVDGNCWRTTGDLGLMSGYLEVGLSNARHYQYAAPGRWNDPDYILIGWVGDAHGHGQGAPCKLTGNQQYQYMSMWSLMAAPLIFSGDMTKLDDFTKNILCNSEVIDIDQDPLGQQGEIIVQNDDYFIMKKQLLDGSIAVGLFNTCEIEMPITVNFEQLEIQGQYQVRDLWRQKGIGTYQNQFKSEVGRYGVTFVKMTKVNK
ncbi:MAG: NPCBM/NEW2 domain-containing protein [Phycisphaerae bacterium]|nr:NPCBM/NEW2 domain-containing protein [Phycisphaerae bacterium]